MKRRKEEDTKMNTGRETARVTRVLYLSKYWLHKVALLELNFCPHGIWIFAKKKLHQLFRLPEHHSYCKYEIMFGNLFLLCFQFFKKEKIVQMFEEKFLFKSRNVNNSK